MKVQYNQLKKQSGVTNEQMAKELEVSTVTLNTYINYPPQMRIKHLQAMSQLFGVTACDLLQIILEGPDYDAEAIRDIEQIKQNK